MDRKQLGDRVQALRKAKGLNQAELASVSGVSGRSLSDIEGGKGNPGLKAIEDLEGALKASLINLAAPRVHVGRAPDITELKAIVRDPKSAESLELANLLLAQFEGAPENVRGLVASLLFAKKEIAKPYLSALKDLLPKPNQK